MTWRLALVLAGTVAGILVVECAAQVFGIDAHVMANALSYVEGSGASDIHRMSGDPLLHYELNPGGHLTGRRGSGEPFTTRIDALGARLPSHAAEKPPGIFRILCFGQSTMHGSAVDDDETIPAALERALNRDHPGLAGGTRYEVWNFGVSGYNLAQAAHLGRVKQAALDPDLILVQIHNIGLRPFFHPQETSRVEIFRRFERTDPDLLDEQFPRPAGVPPWLHRFAVRHVAVYRISLGLRRRLDPSNVTYGESLSEKEARALIGEGAARNAPVVFVAIPADHGGWDPACPVGSGPSSGRIVDLYEPGREPSFYDVHPPARILDDYGRLLAERLQQEGLLVRH